MKTGPFAFVLLTSVAHAARHDPALPCNPAHSYPNGVTCIETHGTLTLVAPTASANSCNLLDVGASCYGTADPPTTTTPTHRSPATNHALPTSTSPAGPVYHTSAPASTSTSSVYASSPAPSYPSVSSSASSSASPSISSTSTLTILTTISHSNGSHTHITGSHSPKSVLPSLKTDTTTPPVPSASAAATSASASASTSTSPASGDAPRTTIGTVMALVAIAALFAL